MRYWFAWQIISLFMRPEL